MILPVPEATEPRCPPLVNLLLLCSLLLAACVRPLASAPAQSLSVDRALVVDVEPTRVDDQLFRDEIRDANRLVFAWAEQQGFFLVPGERSALIHERADHGQRLEDGVACGLPLGIEQYQQALGAAAYLAANVECPSEGKDCQLEVAARHGTPPFRPYYLATGPYDILKPWREALPLALAQLKQVPITFRNSSLPPSGRMTIRDPRGTIDLFIKPTSVVPRSGRPNYDDSLVLAGGNDPLFECFTGAEDKIHLLTASDEAGKVTRCEATSPEGDTTRCACDFLLQHATVAAPLRGRRALVSLTIQSNVVTGSNLVVRAIARRAGSMERVGPGSTYGHVARVSDPSVAKWRVPAGPSLSRCFADLRAPGTLDGKLELHFDASGRTISAKVTSSQPSFSPAQIECVERIFRGVLTPCPTVPSSTADAEVSVDVWPVGDKEPPRRPSFRQMMQ